MVTYRRDAEARGWHRPWQARALLVIVGIVLILMGMAGRAFEDEYGGSADSPEYVIGWDNDLGQAVVQDGERGAVVHKSSSLAGAEAWVQAQRGEKNYSGPTLLLIAGSVLTIVGIMPSPRRRTANHSRMPWGAHP